MQRAEIDKKYKWDLSAIFASDEEFEREFSAIDAEIKKYPAHSETMLCSAKGLFSALDTMTSLMARLDKLWVFSALSYYVDTLDPVTQERSSRARDLAQRFDEATWFVSPYLLKLDESTLDSYIAACPELERFSRYIYKTQRYKAHSLSDEGEELVSRLGDTFGHYDEIRSAFAISDLRFGKIKDKDGRPVQLADTNYITYMMSSERRVRRAAFKTLYKTYDQFKSTFAALYYNYVKEAVTLSRLRGYSSTIERSTFADEVTPEICNNLIDNVGKNLPKLYEYYDLKREVLGLDKMHMYDIYTPLLSDSDDRRYTFEEAVTEVLRSVEVFGEEYHSTMKEGLTKRGWVDVYPSVGKRSGAFSAGCSGTEPYILTNFNGTSEDVSTIAHEAGHSMHSYYSRKFNEPHASRYTLFVAEVASTVNELLLLRMQLREADTKSEKLELLNRLMELYKSTLFRQTMLAEFERDIHALCEAGKPLTAELINKTYYDKVLRYFGDGVVCDPEIALEWARIPHFYMNFYVYKYATCISAASMIVKRIEEEGEPYIKQYIEFLKCGDSRSPLDSLLVAGIDMTSPAIIDAAVESFASAVAEFKRIYNTK